MAAFWDWVLRLHTPELVRWHPPREGGGRTAGGEGVQRSTSTRARGGACFEHAWLFDRSPVIQGGADPRHERLHLSMLPVSSADAVSARPIPPFQLPKLACQNACHYAIMARIGRRLRFCRNEHINQKSEDAIAFTGSLQGCQPGPDATCSAHAAPRAERD